MFPSFLIIINNYYGQIMRKRYRIFSFGLYFRSWEVLDRSRSLERHGTIIGSPCNKVPYQSSLGISRTTRPWYSDDNLRYPLACSGSFALGSFSPTYRDLLPERAKRETANRRYFRITSIERRRRFFPFRYPADRKDARTRARVPG